MAPRLRYTLAVLALLPLVMSALTMWGAAAYFHREQAAQRAQGAVLEQKLCTTLGHLASRRPPAADPADPSRAYLLWQWSTLAELGPDVGCRP